MRERDGCSLVCIGIEFKQEFAKDEMKKTKCLKRPLV